MIFLPQAGMRRQPFNSYGLSFEDESYREILWESKQMRGVGWLAA